MTPEPSRKRPASDEESVLLLDCTLVNVENCPEVLETVEIEVEEPGRVAPKRHCGDAGAPDCVSGSTRLSPAEKSQRGLVSATININSKVQQKLSELRDPFAWMCICPPKWDIDTGGLDYEDEDSDDEYQNMNICDNGKTCICTKPAEVYFDHPWVITYAGYLKWTATLNMVPLRCPDVFGINISCDHEAYGMLEILENLVVEYDKVSNWREKWMVCEALIMFLLGPGMQFSKIHNGDRADAAAELVGAMFLDMLAVLDQNLLLGDGDYEVENLGLMLALFIRFAYEMRQCDLLRASRPRPKMRMNPNHFDNCIREFVRIYKITTEDLPSLESSTVVSDTGNKFEVKAASWLFQCHLEAYTMAYAPKPCEAATTATIGGDRFDLTTWSSIDRAWHSSNGCDPLNKEDIDALRAGRMMQVM